MRTFKQHCLTEAFTRQHYEKIAELINDTLADVEKESNGNRGAIEAVENLAEKLAAMFKNDNPRFDTGIFLRKCGL